MKKVYSSNSQLCHVWAQQTSPEGRAHNMFFTGDSIYSYGRHYKAARIHTINGERFALINSVKYSNTTAKHLSNIRHALNNLMPYFACPNVDDTQNAVEYLETQTENSIDYALKKIKVTSEQEIKWTIDGILTAFFVLNDLRKLLDLKSIQPDKEKLKKVRIHLKARLKRHQELNTPEMIEKRKIIAQKRIASKERKKQEKQLENIQKFRKGENIKLPDLDYDLLRRKNGVIQTSRGAEVPLNEAKFLYRLLKDGQNIEGEPLGNFKIEKIASCLDENFIETKYIKIGCHKILLTEVESILN